MLSKIRTATLKGIDGCVVTVEADIHRGLPLLTVVGLADVTIKEACKRIKPAIINSGYSFPNERVTVNLSPAGKRKEGSHFDLPIAVAIISLQHGGIDIRDTALMGEVSLDGKINPVNGILPLALSVRKAGIKNIILPLKNAQEASVLKDINVFPVTDLCQVTDHIFGIEKIKVYRCNEISGNKNENRDFSQVIGQETAKRAVTIGAAGNHGILMIGSSGCGKTMIAKRIPTIMPELTYEEKLEITGIYSVAGLLKQGQAIVSERPFRDPHHTTSKAALIGGGKKPRPGELSLAHRGVLFLDELGEFESSVIDTMRQPVEDGFIRIKRQSDEVIFPSKVMIVAAANPCRCGNLWDEKKVCTCTDRQLDNYMKKLYGPFSDRIDMHIKMSPVEGSEIINAGRAVRVMSSNQMRKKVNDAVALQRERYRNTVYENNGSLDERGIKQFCMPDTNGLKLMSEAYEKMGISMRAYGKLLKISRTIADLQQDREIREEHVAEALMYRISSVRNQGIRRF